MMEEVVEEVSDHGDACLDLFLGGNIEDFGKP